MALKSVKSQPPMLTQTRAADIAIMSDDMGKNPFLTSEVDDWLATITVHQSLEQSNSVHQSHTLWSHSGEDARGALRTNVPRASPASWLPDAPRVVASGLLVLWIGLLVVLGALWIGGGGASLWPAMALMCGVSAGLLVVLGALWIGGGGASTPSWWPDAPAAGLSVLLVALWIVVILLAFNGP